MADLLARLTTALADRYAIQGELGAGGMATVYLAKDLKLKRNVAVKVLKPEIAAVLGAERFLREVTITAQLEHPHILGLHDSGEADGFLYYVMPYVEGDTLRDRLNREKQLPLDDALQIAREVADALSYAHSRDVIHRDIKPENILLEAGHAVVADFGIARAISAAGGEKLTQTGVALGTPAYMSPEQAAGSSEIDGRSDLYSLGCVLYEMLGGQPPFTGPTVESVVQQHLTAEAPSIVGIRPAVSAHVAAAVARALAKTPADRFSPVALFGEALMPVATTGVPADVPAAALRRPRWHVVAYAGVALLAMIGAYAIGSRFLAQSEPATAGVPGRVVVAVLENETGDSSLDVVGRMAADWITQGLQRTGIVQAVPTQTALQASLFVRSEVAAGRVRDPVMGLATETGAGIIVSGAYYQEGEALRIQVQITNAADGTLLGAPDPVVGVATAPSALVERLREHVLGALALALDERLAERGTAIQPPTFAAYQAFSDGLEEYLIRSDYDAAIPHFYRAFALDSTFITPLVYAGVCHINESRYREADSVLAIAQSSRPRTCECRSEATTKGLMPQFGVRRSWLRHRSSSTTTRPGQDTPTAPKKVLMPCAPSIPSVVPCAGMCGTGSSSLETCTRSRLMRCSSWRHGVGCNSTHAACRFSFRSLPRWRRWDGPRRSFSAWTKPRPCRPSGYGTQAP
jgi:serine/threonine-protein kinase